MKDIDKLKQVFLADDVDEDTRADNEAQIREWEEKLLHSEALVSWRGHDITRELLMQAKETYKDTILTLGRISSLTQEQRATLFAKQNAASWLISLIEVDGKATIEQIHNEIRTKLNAV